jgi:hypothetical protein
MPPPSRRAVLLAVFLILGAGFVLPGSAAQKEWNEKAQLEFLRGHWRLPIPLQGKPPARWNPLEASLSPESCGICHPAQFADWKTSLHAKSMGPGVTGQLVEMLRSDPESALQCYTCHAPLSEQQEKTPAPSGALASNRAFDRNLQRDGITCAACHVRGHQRFGPPKRDGSLESSAPRAQLPHNGVTRTPAFLRAEFCKDCHQFPSDGFALNGKLLENTYNEWKAGPFGKQGVQCQECHMPDRRHLWRGIHDPEMVRSGLTISVEGPRGRHRAGDTVAVTLTVTNSKVGHAFPTYVTPRVVVSGELLDRLGKVVAGSREEKVIAREVPLDLSKEIFDTRLLPGQSLGFRYRRPMAQAGLRLRLAVTVYPDHFYTRFFESLLAQGAGKGTARIQEALAATKASVFTVFSQEIPLD